MNEIIHEQFMEEEIHLRDYLRILRKRRYVIWLVFFIAMIIVLLMTIKTLPVYEATVQVLVEKNSEGGLVGQTRASGYDPEFFETQRQLIISQNVARKVVELLELETKYKAYFPGKNRQQPSFIQTAKDWVKSWLPSGQAVASSGSSAIPRVVPTEGELIADELRKSITVKPVKQSRMMNISFRSENRDFARLVANTIADAYKEEVMSIEMDSSSYALKWMTAKAEEQRENLAKAERALQNYMKKNDIVTVEDKVAVLPQQLSDLTTRLAEAQAQKDVMGNVYNQIEMARRSPQKGLLESQPAVATNGEIQELNAQVRSTEQAIGELRKKFGHKHPTMIEAQAKLGNLQEQKRAVIQKIIASVRSQFEVAAAQEHSLRLSLEQIKSSTLGLNEKMTEYNVLKRDVDTIRALYDALVLKAREKGITEKTQKINVWTTQVAETPKGPVRPRPLRNVLFGIILGIFGGVGCAFFVEYLDNTVKDPEEAEHRFGYSIIGVQERLKKSLDPDHEFLHAPASAFAEGYKSLRTAVLLSAVDKPPKRLMVTSMSPQEGKTTTALNLARAMAQTDRRVLLVDADLRRPRLHKVLQLDNSKGVSSNLTTATEPPVVQDGDVAGLQVLTSGPVPPNPSELLGSARFSDLLDRMESQFDVIILDAPPVLSATDSLLLSRQAEGVIVVCLFAHTTNERLQRGLKMLNEVNASILGLVLNGMDIKQTGYYSQYGYYDYYSASEE